MKNSEKGAWVGLGMSLIANAVQKGTNESLEGRNSKLVRANAELRDLVRKLELREEELEATLAKRDKELEAERAAKETLQTRVTDAEASVAALTAKNADLHGRFEGVKSELTRRRTELADERQQHEVIKVRCRELELELDRLRAQRTASSPRTPDDEEQVA